MTGDGAALVARFKATVSPETFFDRFAGYFHSFNCLEKDVRDQLASGREKEANYRLFGRKYDSLGTLVNRAMEESALADDVSRYLILLCAQQLCNEISRCFPEYWRSRRDDVAELQSDLAHCAIVRGRLAAKSPNMPEFLDWFDQWFLRRAVPKEAEL